jgi:polysaccharide deacetylase 2 family uncharacterized protein YibQ
LKGRQKDYRYNLVKRRYEARNQNKTGRVLAFALGFIVFLTLSSYGFFYIKKKISGEPPEKRISSSDLIKRIGEVDTYIAGALFNLGLSVKDIQSKKLYYKVDGRVEWELRDTRINLPQGVTQEEVMLMLKETMSKPDVNIKLERNEGFLTSEIEIYDFPTHKLRFDFYKKEFGGKPEKVAAKEKKYSPLKEQVESPERKSAKREPEVQVFDKEKPKIVIIIDDLGLNKILIDRLLEIPATFNFAILPHLPYSQYAAEMAYRRGWDVILHLPMEPKNSSGYTGVDAGDGVLLVGLPRNEILAKLENNLASVPYIKGVNNHMGSRFTESGELMEVVLQRIKSRGLFFVDSKTSQNTAGFTVAKKLGMRAAERDVFLDRALGGPNYVRSQIEKLISISKRKGFAIGICHPYPVTVEVLSEMVPKIKKEVEMVAVSNVVN